MSEIINGILRNAVHEHAKHGSEDDHDHDHEDETSSPVVAKAVAMGVLFLTSLILGCLPIKLSKWFKWDSNPKGSTVVQLLLCFGGGVLLCTTFLHLLPEVSESVLELQAEGHIGDMRMHFAEFLMCVGFFTMFFVEECVHYYLHQRQKSVTMGALRRSLSIRRGDHTVSTTELVKNMEETKSNPLSFQSSTTTINSELNHNNTNGHIHSQQNGHHNHNHSSHDHSHAGHSHLIMEAEDSIVKSIRGLLVVLALSIHELFEGLAVGLESSAANVWYMFGAVSAHKLVIAFCIGVELVSTKTRTLLIMVYVFTFAIVSPMGIGIGIGISDTENISTTIASVILQGLASGTLLYVVFFEILQSDRKGGLKQFLAILGGFLLMLTATILGKLFFIIISSLKVFVLKSLLRVRSVCKYERLLFFV